VLALLPGIPTLAVTAPPAGPGDPMPVCAAKITLTVPDSKEAPVLPGRFAELPALFSQSPGRIYDKVKRRPQSIVKRPLGRD
jgi:hypothetical protein